MGLGPEPMTIGGRGRGPVGGGAAGGMSKYLAGDGVCDTSPSGVDGAPAGESDAVRNWRERRFWILVPPAGSCSPPGLGLRRT
jgi:hypothetical protein